MAPEIDIKKLSRDEKLRFMEALWDDLSREDCAVVSPEWHGKALQETEESAVAGNQIPVDWEEAKRDLRNKLGHHED